MNKKIMEDMHSKGARVNQISLKDIVPMTDPTLEAPDQVKKNIYQRQTSSRRRETTIPTYPTLKNRNNRQRNPMLNGFFMLALLTGVYFLCAYFQNAKITVTPKRQSITLSGQQLTTTNDSTNKIHFELMITSNEDSKELTLTQSQTVSQKAEGTVTFYNAHTKTAQKLAMHTVISDSEGKTYLTDKAIVIPGFKMEEQTIVPGQVDVGIKAFLSGDGYNGAPTDFTINAFKGTNKEQTLYAKLKSPLVGGAEGLVYMLGPNDIGTLHAFAVSGFKNAILKKVQAEIPEGYILYPSGMRFSYVVDENVLSKTPMAEINLKGKVVAILIREKDLSDALINSILPGISEEEFKEIELTNIGSLVFAFNNPDQIIDKEVKTITFKLTGALSAVWHPDIDKLRNNSLGVNKNYIVEIFKKDPGIEQARVKLFPPWQQKIPAQATKVHVVLE